MQVGTFDVTIENPKGSKRSGTDADGKRWETTMTHTYGYIRGTKGVDGDHIDVYLSSDIDGWNGRKVFVVDQYNPDGTFDEHKVMLGFNDKDEAFEAYLSNYEAGWENGRRLDVTAVNLDDFEKWIESSKRKTKAFADYKSIKSKENNSIVGRSLSEQEASDLIARMETNAEVAPAIELTPENWITLFGEDGTVETPIGIVKMGENQYFKMAQQGRNGKLGMIKPTLQAPNVIVEDFRLASSVESERDSSYIFVKTFTKDNGERYYHFTSVTVRKDGREVVISNQERTKNRISKLLQQGTITWINDDSLYPKAQVGKSVSLNDSNIPTNSDNGDALLGVNSSVDISSDGKDNTLSSDKQTESAESSDGYSIEPRKDTRDNSDIFAVKFEERVSREVFKGQKAIAKKHGGYWSNFGKKGFLFKTREEAEAFANEVMGKPDEAVAEDAPVSLSEIESAIKPSETEIFAPETDKTDTETENSPASTDISAVTTPKQEKKKSKWVDEEDAEEFERLRKILRNGLGQLNSGFPPELLYAGGKMSYLMMKHGVRKFAEYATAMIEELGDAIRPHLKSLYNFTRSTEEVIESEWADELTPFDEVMRFDTANFGKNHVDAMATAENVVAEEASQQHLSEAEKKLKEERNVRLNPDGSTTETINEGGVEVEVTRGDFIPGVYPPIDDKPKKPGKKKGSKPKQSEQKPTASQLDLFGDEEQQIINDVIAETTMPEPKPEAELSGDSAAYQDRTRQERDLVEDIIVEIMKRADMKVGGEDRGPLTMRDIKGMLENYNTLTDISATDLQELVERAMTILTRKTAKAWQADPRKGYDRVVAYYNMQPMLNARDSERLIKQQYSTPTPFGYVMGQFVNAKSDAKSILEPSAGNGALTIMFDPATVHVNDIDERRLENLRTLGYNRVTAQNGLLPFDGEKVDGILTNPPFGTVSEKIYDNIFKISSLEGQMAINALNSMKDGGRAAIIIGGNTSYRTNGSMNPKDAAFFGYLYSHYNVVDVINISGKALYARNGTGYDVRMILINGRKTGDFSRVYPPVKSKARAEQVTTFDELYKRVEDDIQQVFQMGRKPADEKSGSGRPTDRGTSAPVGSGNNRTNQGAGERPDATGNGIGGASESAIEQPTQDNEGSRPVL